MSPLITIYSPKFQIVPDLYQQFTSQSNNTDFVQTITTLTKAVLIPTTELAIRLEVQLNLGDFDSHCLDMTIPELADAQFVGFFTALLQQGCQTSPSSDFETVPQISPGNESHYPRQDKDSPKDMPNIDKLRCLVSDSVSGIVVIQVYSLVC